jgi:hypothetical protein
VQLAKSNDIC